MFTFDGYSHSVATQESRDELVVIATTTSLEKNSENKTNPVDPPVQRIMSVIRSEASSQPSSVSESNTSEHRTSEDMCHHQSSSDHIERESPSKDEIDGDKYDATMVMGVNSTCLAQAKRAWFDTCGMPAFFDGDNDGENEEEWIKRRVTKDDPVPFDEDPESKEMEEESIRVRRNSTEASVIEEQSKELVLAQIGDKLVRQSLFDKDADLMESAPSDEADNKSPEAMFANGNSEIDNCCTRAALLCTR